MSDPPAFLAALQGRGFTLRAQAARLLVSPASQLTDDDKELIAMHKVGLLLLLEGCYPPSFPPEFMATQPG